MFVMRKKYIYTSSCDQNLIQLFHKSNDYYNS